MNKNLNELMELKNYVNYLIESVLYESRITKYNDDNSRETYNKRMDQIIGKQSDQKYIQNIRDNDKDMYLRAKADKELYKDYYWNDDEHIDLQRLNGQAYMPEVKDKMKSDHIAKIKSDQDAMLSKIPSANMHLDPKKEAFKERLKNYSNSPKAVVDDVVRKAGEHKGALAGAAGIAGLGVAGYAAYKLAKKRKAEKEKANKK